MTQGNFNPEQIGSAGLYWWTGIIVSDESWKDNEIAEKWNTLDQLPGWGERYKVRIVGKHTGVREKLSDDKLELCEVVYPVTGGTGHAASYQTSNLRQGSVVIGFYKDGTDGNEPIILGCIGNNDQTVLKRVQQNGFDTLSGYTSSTGTARVAKYSIPPGGSPRSRQYIGEALSNSTDKANNAADQRAAEDQRAASPIASPYSCDLINFSGIQLKIQNLILDIEKKKKEIYDWRYSITNEIISENGQKFGVEEYVAYKVGKVAADVTAAIKNLVLEVQKKVKENVEKGAKNFYYLLFPNSRPKAKVAIETANELITCLFRKIIGQLISVITKFLLSAVNKYINVPLCAAENILGGIIGKLSGLLNSAIKAIMGPVNAILGAVDLVGDIFDIVIGILSFIKCDDPPSCSKVKEWSIYDGPGPGLNLDIGGLINKVKSFAGGVQQSVDPDNFDFDLDFDDVFNNPCNINAILCGPPTVEFFGGGGSGASGNAIISASGQILGVDIISTGGGYSNPPIVRFVDACGKGSGAFGRAVIGRVPKSNSDGTGTGTTGTGAIDGNNNTDIGNLGDNETTLGVIAVIMDETGIGYLPTPNGDQGGGGRTWAEAEDTTIQNSNGDWQIPIPPGNTVLVNAGDTVTTPPGTSIPIVVTIGTGTTGTGTTGTGAGTTGTGTGTGTAEIDEVIVGGVPYIVQNSGTITTPFAPGVKPYEDYPSSSDGSYPVILYLGGLEISDPGFLYSEGDTVVIEPSNGAIAEITLGPFGLINGVKVTSPGEGFTEVPEIFIQTETGYNARLLPRFFIDRISQDELKEPTPEIQDKIISVIDCVGKIPQTRREFFRVPL